jgi:hypothetical protein
VFMLRQAQPERLLTSFAHITAHPEIIERSAWNLVKGEERRVKNSPFLTLNA